MIGGGKRQRYRQRGKEGTMEGNNRKHERDRERERERESYSNLLKHPYAEAAGGSSWRHLKVL